MPLIRLAPGAKTDRCPTCGSPMGRTSRGRITGLFYRHCQNPNRCDVTTITSDVPPEFQAPAPLTFPQPARLPLEDRSLARELLEAITEERERA